VPCSIQLDLSGYDSGFYRDEITDPKAWIANILINGDGNVVDPQTRQIYACRSFAGPGHDLSAGARDALIGAGYAVGRGELPDWDASDTIERGALVDVNMYTIPWISAASYLHASTEADVRLNARSLACTVIQSGMVLSVLSHRDSELSLDEWDWCLDEWSRFGDSLVVTSDQLFADTVRAVGGPWTDDGDGTYSRTYNNYSDYHLTAGANGVSPCIDTGFSLGDDYDEDFEELDQDDYGFGWEIGPYVYSPLGRPVLLHGQ